MPAALHRFPATRPERDPGIALAPLGGESPPTIRTWPFLCDASIANSRTIIVSPSFKGPCLIYEVGFRIPGAQGSFGGLAIFWSTDASGSVQNGATTLRPTGTPIFEPAVIASTVISDLDEIREHVIYANPGTDPTTNSVMRPARIVNYNDQIFLKVTTRSHPAGGNHCRGWITVVEGASVEQLAGFL